MTGRPDPPSDPVPATRQPREAAQRWRLIVAREAVDPEQAQRAQMTAWDAALRACGLPVAGLDGTPARPRFAIAAPLGASIPGEAELVEVWLVERLPRWRVREALADAMPPRHRLLEILDVWLGEPALPGQVVASVYRADLGGTPPAPGELRSAALSVIAAAALPRTRRKGDATVGYDLRPFVDGLEIIDDPAGRPASIRMTLRHDPEKGVGRPDELIAELGDRLGAPLDMTSLVRERLVLAPEVAPPAPRPGAPQATTAPARRGRR